MANNYGINTGPLQSYAELENSNNAGGYPNSFLEQRHDNLIFNQHYKDYDYYEEDPKKNNIARDILKGILEISELSNFFFSKKNLDHLQYLIIREVRRLSEDKFKISRQDDNELLIVMRSIYLQYSKNLPYNIKEQVAELNKQVLLDVIPRVMVRIEQYLGFMRDNGRVAFPLARGQYVSSAGTRTTKGFSSVFI